MGDAMSHDVTTTLAVLTHEQLRHMLVEAAEEGARRVIQELDSSEWMNKDAVADMLGYKDSYISELVRRRGLPCHRVGRKMRFRREEVEEWLTRTESTSR